MVPVLLSGCGGAVGAAPLNGKAQVVLSIEDHRAVRVEMAPDSWSAEPELNLVVRCHDRLLRRRDEPGHWQAPVLQLERDVIAFACR